MKVATKLNLIDYLDNLVAEGKEIKMGWEGGGDSGWCWFEIDGEQISDSDQTPEIEILLEHMYDHLDYGSWAGEFSANGEAVYNATEKAFVGTDYYSEDETVEYNCNIDIRIPKKLWFDRIDILIEDYSVIVTAEFSVRNGFITPEHEAWKENFCNDFAEKVREVTTAFGADPETDEYRSMWHELNLDRNLFTEEGDDLVYNVDSLEIGSCDTDDKTIYLDLKTITVEEDDNL